MFKKTCESFGEDVDKLTCQEFLQTFNKFFVDYEVELNHYKEKKLKEQKEKEKQEEKERIQRANLEKIEKQKQDKLLAKKQQQQQETEVRSQRGAINNMIKTIRDAEIGSDDKLENENIVNQVESKRAARIRNLLAKKKVTNNLT